MQIDWNVVSHTLQLMWKGMLAVFVVMLIILVMVQILYRATRGRGGQGEQ